MKLSELPAMFVERIEQGTDGTTVYGRFDRLDGVRESGCFRLARGKYAWADLTIVDRASCLASALVTYVDDGRMSAGDQCTWLDSYWQLPFVEAVADETTEWRRFSFQARDAQYFRQGNAVGWREVGGGVPDGAVNLGVKKSGWDHEHCDLCGTQINVQKPIGYTDDDGHFLCADCFHKHGATHDVSFQLNV
jgi:hypothetical protein